MCQLSVEIRDRNEYGHRPCNSLSNRCRCRRSYLCKSQAPGRQGKHQTKSHQLTLCQFAGLVVYRLCFHPLAKYPGPFLAKITDVHQLYHAWKGDRHLEFWRMHERYGTQPEMSRMNSVSRYSYPIIMPCHAMVKPSQNNIC